MLRFADEFIEVEKAIRVQQPQAGKMAGQAELFRSGRQKQEARRPAADRLHQRVFRTDRIGCPAEMMGFIDNEHVPLGGQCLLQSWLTSREQADAAQHELIV